MKYDYSVYCELKKSYVMLSSKIEVDDRQAAMDALDALIENAQKLYADISTEPPSRGDREWPEPMRVDLREMYEKGQPYKEIAQILAGRYGGPVTKNAICGAVNRYIRYPKV